MKPLIHAQSSVKKFGGETKDYIKIHEWFDQTKAHVGDNRHRAILHNSFGIFLAEQMFGSVIVNSDNKEISVRDIGEQHVMEDMNGWIPSIQDYLDNMAIQPWMCGEVEDRPSNRKTATVSKTADELLQEWVEKYPPSIPKLPPPKYPPNWLPDPRWEEPSTAPKAPFINPNTIYD